jgi:hypothetical protein
MASNLTTIITALKTALGTIKPANGYNLTVAEVIEGPALLTDAINRPGIAVYYPTENIKNYVFGKSEAEITVFLWGYVDAKNPRDFTNLKKLHEDLLSLLGSSTNWTYQEWTDVKSVSFFFGGSTQSVGILQLEMTISYRYNFGSP